MIVARHIKRHEVDNRFPLIQNKTSTNIWEINLKAKHSNLCVNFWHNLGRLLLVGEGNFSFARSLLKNGFVVPEDLVCTTIENEHELSSEATLNVLSICHSGGEVGVRVDGRILEKSFRPQTFDSVGFQFPHAGTR